MGTNYVHQDQNSAPLCPMVMAERGNPHGKMHRDWVSAQDAADAAAPLPQFDNPSPEEQAAHDKELMEWCARFCLPDGLKRHEADRMNLYRVTSMITGSTGGVVKPNTWVESWYFLCPVCSFVLPAQAI